MTAPSPRERRDAGRARRATAPRFTHAGWTPSASRRDPVAILLEQAETRVAELLPIRHARMAASPFAFLRGAAAVMAADLATIPSPGLRVQCCGDAHLSNFGLFASPERRLVFDLNDFDETLPGPFEFDVKRLTASVAVAARGNGERAAEASEAARAAAAAYRTAIREFAAMGALEVWYASADVDALAATSTALTKATRRTVRRARARTSLHAFAKICESVDGTLRFRDDPPLLEHLPELEDREGLRLLFAQYRETLPEERRTLLDRFTLVDIARKVVGVGSVGTRAFVLLLTGRDEGDPLILQVKEAGGSVLAPHVGRARHRHEGKRVVVGQRLMQATSDIFLGWLRGPAGRDFYVRQLRDMKGSAEIETLELPRLTRYAELCGWVLARAHARTGDAAAIAGYLGGGDRFDLAMRDWAGAYADQTERDHEALVRAIDEGRVEAQPVETA